jgi:CMP-N,N'-diacetyllegionaminic acid synthase
VSLTVAIIPARGGSKGIPRKNLIEVCGKPLIAWSILQARHAHHIDSVWVSSDDDEILGVSETFGALPIRRPTEISGDEASSESAWLHAVNAIENQGVAVDAVVAMQATSPIREPSDLDSGVQTMRKQGYDSILSVAEVEDFFTWRIGDNGCAQPVNYDYRNRKRRQEIEKRYLENGSFYVFRPEQLRRENNRLGGRIGLFVMGRHKMFQIDSPDDIELCSSIMRGFKLDALAHQFNQ